MKFRHLSYSSMNQLDECSWKYKLERVDKLPGYQYFANLAGSAFHMMTEHYDYGIASGSMLFQDYLDDQLLDRESDWTYNSEGLPERRDGSAWTPDLSPYVISRNEDYAWWVHNGQEMYNKYVEWRESSGWKVAEGLPFLGDEQDGDPRWGLWSGIEYPVSLEIPDSGGAVFKGYIDRIFVTPEDEVVVVDLKTWFREGSSTQLGTYYTALQFADVPVDKVAYYHARDGRLDDPWVPVGWSVERLGRWMLESSDVLLSDAFEPNPSYRCRWCTQRDNCEFFPYERK